MDNSLFYCGIAKTKETSLAPVLETLQQYAEQNSKQVYVLDRILGTGNETRYSASGVAVIFMPKHPVLFLNYGNDSEKKVEDFRYEFVDDLSFYSKNYDYDQILGRFRDWEDVWFVSGNISDFDIRAYIENEIAEEHERKIDLLISLAIGSINSIHKIGIEEPQTTLDKVKKRSFYSMGNRQGLSTVMTAHQRLSGSKVSQALEKRSFCSISSRIFIWRMRTSQLRLPVSIRCWQLR